MAKYEIRCHETGDDSDYHWEFTDTREEAERIIKEFNSGPGFPFLYEHLYIIEVSDSHVKTTP